MKRICRTCVLAAVLLGGLLAATGRSQPEPKASLDTDAELNALLAAVRPAWSFSSSASAALGYNDNILLSSIGPVGRGFARSGVDALLWHLPAHKVDYFAFLNAEYTRYSRRVVDETGNVVDHTAQAFAGLEWRFKQPEWLTATVDGQGYALDQVFDLSNVSGKRDVENLNVRGVKAGPTVRVAPFRWVWIEGNAMSERQRYRDGLNDAKLHESAVRLGFKSWDRLELRGDATQRTRAFDRRHPFDPDVGIFQKGLLAIVERGREARLTATLGRARHWTVTTRAGVLKYTDNATGDLNFHERHVAERIEWSAAAWTVSVEGESQRKIYDAQFVGGFFGAPHQVKEESNIEARLERKISARWTVYADYRWERSRSNDEIVPSYRVNEGSIGARWTWEK